MQKQNWQEWIRLILCYIEVSSYWPISFNSRKKKEQKKGEKKFIALGRKSVHRALPVELDDLHIRCHRKTIVSTILAPELFKSIHKLLMIPRFVRMGKAREKKWCAWRASSGREGWWSYYLPERRMGLAVESTPVWRRNADGSEDLQPIPTYYYYYYYYYCDNLLLLAWLAAVCPQHEHVIDLCMC
jgi:hypothetical protein